MKNYAQSFTGIGMSDNGIYDLSFSGTLSAELKEGENLLNADQLQGIELKGTAVGGGGTVGVWNQNKVTNAKAIVTNGEISSLTLYGNAKTTTSKQDTFAITTSANSQSGKMFNMTGTSVSEQYTVTLAGNLPTDLKEGENNLDPTVIKSLKLYGVWYREEDNDSKFYTQTNITTLSVEVSGGKITKVTTNGSAKTANGTKETFTISATY